MIGSLAAVAAAEVVDRSIARRRRARRRRDRAKLPGVTYGPARDRERCATCGDPMMGGLGEARPYCVRQICTVGRRNLDVLWARHRDEYAVRQARQAQTRAVRHPPRNERPAPGTCSLCSSPIPEGSRRRTWCSQRCVDLWDLATRPSAQRAQLRWWFDGCWSCGRTHDDDGLRLDLDVDHIRPLWSLTEVERGELRWWLPFNLQLLCPDCHKRKTRAEAGARAAQKKSGKSATRGRQRARGA